MPNAIYVDPALDPGEVIRVGSQCYQRVGPSSTAPDTFSIEDSFENCTTCESSSSTSSGSSSGSSSPPSSSSSSPTPSSSSSSSTSCLPCTPYSFSPDATATLSWSGVVFTDEFNNSHGPFSGSGNLTLSSISSGFPPIAIFVSSDGLLYVQFICISGLWAIDFQQDATGLPYGNTYYTGDAQGSGDDTGVTATVYGADTGGEPPEYHDVSGTVTLIVTNSCA